MSDLQKIEAVFVYRHRLTGIVNAHYMDTALHFDDAQEWEHVATLTPRAWIEFNYSLVEQRDELLAAAKNLRDVKGRYNTEIAMNRLIEIIAKVESEK